MARVFLDANVFLYALGGDGPHRASCRALLAAVGDGTIDGVTSSEVLREIVQVRARRLGIDDATAAVRAAANLVEEVLPVTHVDVLAACDLLGQQPSLGARDALHIAVMKNAGIRTVISVDRDFDRIKGVRRVDPTDAL